jgi:voltage-gated sodium channel
MGKIFAICKIIASSNLFKNGITVTILIAGILVGVETYEIMVNDYHEIFEILDLIILTIFILEIIIKILQEGKQPWKYFNDGWNIFDFIIVASVFLPFTGSSIAVLRLLRLLRVLKLVKALPKLQLLVSALLKSIPSMGYVTLLLVLLFYIYAVAGVSFFGYNDPVHFKDLQIAMLSLFRVVTLEDWTDIMYINMYGCDKYGYDNIRELCTTPNSSPFGAALFFVSFVLVGTMVILNLFIGVIMTGMEEAKESLSGNKS